MKWEVTCSGVIAPALLHSISRHNKLYYDKVLWKYRIAEWYWRESGHLRQERPSLYYGLILAQQFLLQIQSWNWFRHAFYAIHYLPQYSDAFFQILPNPFALDTFCGVEHLTYDMGPCDLTAVLPEPPPSSSDSEVIKPC